MITQHQEHLISLLLASFPNFQSGDSDAALASYALVIEPNDPRDVQAGIRMIIAGELPGFDGRFAPTATQLARAIRLALEKRVDAENAQRRRLPPPADEWVEPTPEQKERVKTLLLNLAKDLRADQTEQEAEDERKRLAQLRRTNARFAPDQAPNAMAHRLGFSTINTADDDRWDMGGAA